MRKRTAAERLETAQQQVREASALLIGLRADRLEECGILLREAQRQLESLRDTWQIEPPGRQLRSHALDLARDIRRARALLEHGVSLGAAWLARWHASTAGYTASGSPASLALERISIEG
jgi:hypothetical protein